MITLTDKAIEKVRTLQEEDELKAVIEGKSYGNRASLRIGVRSGGCSGFSYDMYFDFKEAGVEDWVGEFGGGSVSVVVDSESAPYLLGAVLDYKEGLQGAGFVFNNPNVNRSCGCGQSFS